MIRIKDKYALTIKEASEYFGIGEARLYMLASEHSEADDFAFMKGRHYMIIREEFERYLHEVSSI